MTDCTMYEWFAGSVDRYPDEPALEVEDLSLTYRELHALVLALAGEILTEYGSPPKRVGLLASRSVIAFTGYLAALRLGATVIPLNPEHPAQRNQLIADAAAFDVLLADDPTATPLPKAPTVLVSRS